MVSAPLPEYYCGRKDLSAVLMVSDLGTVQVVEMLLGKVNDSRGKPNIQRLTLFSVTVAILTES